MLIDTQNNVLLSGGRPVIVCNLSSMIFISSWDLNGTVQYGTISPDGMEYTFLINNLVSETNPTIMESMSVLRSSILSPVVVYLSAPFAPLMTTGSTQRLLLAAAAFTSPVIVETIAIDSNTDLVVYSNGVVQNFTNTGFAGQYSYASYFTEVLGADISSSVLISPTVLVLGGYLGSSWQIVNIPLPLDSGTPTVITAQVQAATSFCSSYGCTSTGKLKIDGTYAYISVLTNSGAGIIQMRLTQLNSGNMVISSGMVISNFQNVIVNVTAMYLDSFGGAGYIALNLYSPSTGPQPSTIYRFSLITMQVYGSVAFQTVVSDNEIVTGFVVDPATRTLYASVPLNLQVSIVPLSLYAVTALFPNIADTYGGTVITVSGQGFLNVTGMQCDFNGTIVPGTFISSQQINCVAPTGGDERCEGVPLEVSVAPNQFTNNGVLLRRVSSPRISSVYNSLYSDSPENAYGPQAGGVNVILIGFGFQFTLYQACRFMASNVVGYAYYADIDYERSNGAQGTLYNDAIFVNSTMMICRQPAFLEPTSGPATLEVTLDGTVYSRSGNLYEVVGAPAGLLAFRLNGTTWTYQFNDTYQSGNQVFLQSFTIFVVDIMNQRLRMLDTTTRNISMALGNFTYELLTVGSASSPFNFSSYCQFPQTIRSYPVFYATGQTWNTTTDGQTTFVGGYFLRPPTGTYTMIFADQATRWTYSFSFTVTVGAAASLHICQEPSPSTNNLQPTLKQQPVLYVEDIAGNQLNNAALQGLRVTATYLTEYTVTTAVSAADQNSKTLLGVPINVQYFIQTQSRIAQVQGNFLQFDGIAMQGLYGSTYNVTFSSPGLPNITSWPVSIQWCNNNTAPALINPSVLMYFAKWGTSECFVCPVGGICDGTTSIETNGNNLWRANNDSYVFYSCAVPYGGDSCLAPDGACKVGYDCPRCSCCAPGYGHDGYFCIPCPSDAGGYIFLLILIMIAFIGVALYISHTTYALDSLPSVVKMAFNHFQVSSRINDVQVFPTALTYIFTVQLNLSELIRFDAVPAQCNPMNLSVYDIFFFVISMPFMAMAILAIGLLGLALYRHVKDIKIRCIPVAFTEASKNVRRERVMLVVARFMERLRKEAQLYHSDLHRDDARPQFYSFFEYLGSWGLLVLVMIYPSVLYNCLIMFQCDSIVEGDGSTLVVKHFLIADRSIDCDSAYHKKIQSGALFAAFFYGFAVPGFAFGFIKYWWGQFGGLHSRRLFTWILSAYDREVWWWELSVLGRKMLVVFVVYLISDDILRTYLMMWVMAVALGLHGWFQPFDALFPQYYYLEGLGITTIVVTLNLSLLFQFSSFQSGTAGNTFLVVILLAMNILVTGVFLFVCGWYAWKRFRRWRNGGQPDPEEDEQFNDQSQRVKRRQSAIFGEAALEDEDAKQHDRKAVQRDGILGLLRHASNINGPEDRSTKVVVDPNSVPVAQGETPFERLKRLETEKRKQFLRKDQAKTQANLEEELNELKERLARAEALAAAEEAVIARNPHMAIRRQQHEEELMRLMEQIQKERGGLVKAHDDVDHFDALQFEDRDNANDGEDEEDDEGFFYDNDY
jgi:hypothetical protein